MTDTMTRTSTWVIDTSHSSVEFAVKHMMFSTVKGSFTEFSGQIVLDEQNIENSTVTVDINPRSVNTRDEKRDEHLRSADFFGIEQNPTMTFVSTRIEADGDDLKITGDLTMNGATREVVLDAEFNGRGMSPFGMEVIGYTAKTKINRRDFNINWNAALEAGGMLVSEDVKITLDIEAVPAQA
ncbi:MAG TPA: YceI family protein [Thermomicrobiales bacterium]|nr:YceI family protein [Thermomicrobiales bacterium]